MVQQSQIFHYVQQESIMLLNPCGSQIQDVIVNVDPTNLAAQDYINVKFHEMDMKSVIYEQIYEIKIDNTHPKSFKLSKVLSDKPLWITMAPSKTCTVPISISLILQGPIIGI
jgi:hypothetical protein